jgi:hypothetical protein
MNMGYLSVLTERQLLRLTGTPSNDRMLLEHIVHTMFAPRFIRVADMALTLVENHRGAIILLTNAAAVTVTLPSLGNGFLTTIIPLGAGGATISGTHVGGSTVAQNGMATAMTLDDGSWFVTGAA